jgi:hypothetical protein
VAEVSNWLAVSHHGFGIMQLVDDALLCRTSTWASHCGSMKTESQNGSMPFGVLGDLYE